MTATGNITFLERDIVSGRRIDRDEALALLAHTPTEALCALADGLRRHFHGNSFDMCSIMNARSGRCSEDCKWCSQSKYHTTDVETYPLADKREALAMARGNEARGVGRFSIVTSGRRVEGPEMDRLVDMVREVAGGTGLKICASLGLMDLRQMVRLREAGVERYHCNLETAPSFFPLLCTTHTVREKIRTLRWAREAGMEVCSGGIAGMGESMEQRVEMALVLREIGVDSVPLNMLNPIRGTALENMPRLTDDDVLRTAAIFIVINPQPRLRLAGGQILYRHLKARLLHSGVSASIVGDMLTTTGADIETDRKLFEKEGFSI